MRWENKIILPWYSVFVCNNCGAEIKVEHDKNLLPDHCEKCGEESYFEG
jgi:DNA-directed RNA polymerase subunit RPC12/RpoP